MYKEKKCIFCKKIFGYYDTSRLNAQYCGNKCRALHNKSRGVNQPPIKHGKDHGSYKNGHTMEE